MPTPRLEIWDTWECNSGSMKDVIRDVETAEETEEIQGEKGKILLRSLNITFPLDDPSFANIVERDIVRIVDTPVREYRVFHKGRSHSGPKMAKLECLGPEYDLKYSKIVRRVEANRLAQPYHEAHKRPPTEHIDIILGAFSPFVSGAPSYFSRGTVQFTEPKDMIYDWDTPLSALEELAEIYEAEIEILRNGSTSLDINMLTQIGATADSPLFTIGRNILSVSEDKDSEEQANIVFVQGGGAVGERGNMSENGFEVTGVSGADLTFAESIVHEDDQWNTRAIREPDGTITAITDSAAPNQISATGHGVAVGDIVRIVEADGSDLLYVESPSSIAVYDETSKILDRSDVPNINNYLRNAFFEDWTSGGVGDAPCIPKLVAPPPAGSSLCLTRALLGLVESQDFGDQSELLPSGWVHRVKSTDAISDATALTVINGLLGLNLNAQNFGIYEQKDGGARNTTSSGFAIFQPHYSDKAIIQAEMSSGVTATCQQAGLMAKWQGPNNYYLAQLLFFSGSVKARIFRVQNGNFTQVGATYDTTETDCATTFTIKFVVEDGLQEMYIDNVLRVSGTDTAHDGVSGFTGFYTADPVDSTTGNGAIFDDFRLARGPNEIVVRGLAASWTIEACGEGPTAADAQGKATLDLAGSDLNCANLIVRDDVAAIQDTFTSAIGIWPGDEYDYACDDRTAGVTGLNRTRRGHMFFDDFNNGNTCWLPGLLQLTGGFQFSSFGISGGYRVAQAPPQDEFHRLIEKCWQDDEMFLQTLVRSVGNTLSEPGLGKISHTANGVVGYLAYISDAAGGTLHLAELTHSPPAQPVRTDLDTDTFTYSADTDYYIQLYINDDVQEARLYNSSGTLLASCSATDTSHFTSDHWGTLAHVSSSGGNTSWFDEYRSFRSKDIVVNNMPSGYTAEVLDVNDAVVASAVESGGVATIDMMANDGVYTTNEYRAVAIQTGGVESVRYQGVVSPGDIFDVI